MALLNVKEHRLLNGVSATGAGDSLKADKQKGWNFIFYGASVSTGATIKIEVEVANGGWASIHEQEITANGYTVAQSEHGHFRAIRANVTAYTDGTYWVYAQGSTTGY